MDSKVTNEIGSSSCNRTIWAKYIFLVQGIILVAVGIVGLLTYTCSDVECERLKNRNILLLSFASLHVIASLVCCIHCMKMRTNWRLFIAYVFWGCVISSYVTFQTLRLYEYKQIITHDVLYAIIMTGILDLLVLIVCVLHIMELCNPKPDNDEKSEKLLLDQS